MKTKLSLLLLVFLVSASLPLVRGDADFTLKGRIVNGAGVPIAGASIKIYGSGYISAQGQILGIYLKTVYTDDVGEFTFTLTENKLILRIGKTGYQTLQQTVTFPYFGSANIGDLRLTENLNISLLEGIRSISPLGTLKIPFQIENLGDSAETVAFYARCSEGFTARVKDQAGEVSSLKLPAQATQALTLEVSAPIVLPDNAEVKLTIKGTVETVMSIALTTAGDALTFMTSDFSSKASSPDTINRFDVTLSNPSGLRLDALLLLNFPLGWEGKVLNSAGDDVDRVSLAAGASVKLSVEVSIPVDAAPGVYFITLAAEAGGTQFTVPLTMQVKQLTSTATVEVSAKYPALATEPGQKSVFKVQVANTGDVDQLLSLSVSGLPADWSVQTLAADGSEIGRLKIVAGAKDEVSVLVTPGVSTAPGAYPFKAEFTGGVTDASLPLLLNVKPSSLELASSELSMKVGAPGSSLGFEATVTNPTDSTQTIRLEARGLPASWSGKILGANGDGVTGVTLAAGKSTKVTVKVEIPLGAAVGESAFSLAASLGGISDSQILVARVEATETIVSVKTLYPSQSVEIGKTTSFRVTLENPSNVEETVSLKTEGLPENWVLRFKNLEGLQIQQILLSAQGKQDLVVEASSSLTAEPKNYSFKILAQGQVLKGSLQLTIGLQGTHSVAVTVSSLYEQVSVGSTTAIQVRVTNTGYSPLTDVALQLTSSSTDIGLDAQPIKMPLLKPNEYQTFTVTVSVPQGVAAADYALNVATTAREFDSAQGTRTIRLTVASGTNITMIAGGLVVVCLLGVALLIRRFRRT